MAGINDKKILERRVFSTGDLIMEEGEPGSCAYLIQQGKVRVFSGEGERKVTLGYVEMGEIFGETALFYEDNLRTASVEAVEMTTVIEITKSLLKKKLEKSDPTIRAIVQMLTERMLKNNQATVQSRKTLRNLELLSAEVEHVIRESLPLETMDQFRETIYPTIKDLETALGNLREQIQDIL